jgi:hypothetical protein
MAVLKTILTFCLILVSSSLPSPANRSSSPTAAS